MKTVLFLAHLFLVTGCYTQVKLSYPYDYEMPTRSERLERTARYQQNQEPVYEDGYEDGYDDGYFEGTQVFTDWTVANRWNSYYNRFYWVDPYWNAPFYDAFLWDPFFGAYGGWGMSYYHGAHFGGGFMMYPFYTNRWFGGFGYWNNIVFVGNGHGHGNNVNDGNTRWVYGPRNSSTTNSTAVRPRNGSTSNPTGSGYTATGRRPSINATGTPRSGSGNYTVPTRRPSTGSTGSGGTAVSRPSKSSNSGSGTVKSSGGSSSSSPRSSSSSGSGSSSSGKSSSSSRPSRSGN